MTIKNLVLSGGSVKGISFLGALKVFEEYQMIDSIKTICGSSIGALIATLICLKYTYIELRPIFFKLNFDNLQDINGSDIFNFFEDYGFDSGENFLRIIEILIKAKTDNSKITFLELYKITKIKLVITATCVNSKNIVYYDFEKTPNDCVSIAIRKSVSIPLLFKPVLENDKYYVDGALINNFPIDIFENNINNTLGIIISSEEDKHTKISNFETYLLSLIECSYRDGVKKIIEKYFKHIVVIKTNIHFLNFFITDEQKEELITLGYNTTIEYLNKYTIKLFDYGDLLKPELKEHIISVKDSNITNYKLYNISNNPVIMKVDSSSNVLFGKIYIINNNFDVINKYKNIKIDNLDYNLELKDNLYIYLPKINKSILKDKHLLTDGKWILNNKN